MKNLLLILIIICLGFNLYGQERDFGIPQRPIKPIISVPKLLDSIKLSNDIRKLKVLKDIYKKLKSNHVGAVYQYSFYVNTNGKITLSIPEKKDYLKPINHYTENVFFNYRWLPAYRLNCKSCLVKTFGILSFIFDTDGDNDQVFCIIYINNEKEYKVFFDKLTFK